MKRSWMGAAALILTLAWPATGWTWGADGHHYIAQNYSKHLPAYMDGLKTYDATVYTHVTDPDTRKGSTPGEAPKHYIDIDWYPEFAQGTLSHNRATLEAKYGASTVSGNGVVPWAVGDAMTTLTQQFQAKQWSAAALTIADMCHYVGDSHQPLHCTQNYDGAMTGNSGIHSRYESTMLGAHLGELSTPVMSVTYYSSPVDQMFSSITTSWSKVSGILQADNTAKTASGGSYNTTYYNSLWNSTKAMTQVRLDSASVVTASMVYTAWVNAGRPAVPGSTAVDDGGALAGVAFETGPSPFRGSLPVHFSGKGPFGVDVLDVRGARVASLARGASGDGRVTWSPSRSSVGAGVYFVRLTAPGLSRVSRVVYLK